jgi:uncharacterized glyoxalase superfamily protein PhnB
VNLLVREVAPVVRFLTEVLQVELVYDDPDLAVLRHEGVDWMIHANLRGAGCELRLYNLDPDAAEARARAAGYEVLAPSEDKPHGLRECYLLDPEGYIWVPGRPLPPD